MSSHESTVQSVPKPPMGPKVPPGRVAVNDKWYGTPLGKELTNNKIAFFAKDLGLVDFYVTSTMPLVYITQAELMVDGGNAGRTKLKNVISVHPQESLTILTDRNTTTITAYDALIDFACFELELYVIPVASQMELPHLLLAWANEEAKPHSSNPFMRDPKPNLAELQAKLLSFVPGLSEQKGEALLRHFNSIQGIANASVASMSPIVGSTVGSNVWKYFHEKIIVKKDA